MVTDHGDGRKPNYYALLGVPKGASVAEIKRAYRKLAWEHHPDRAPSDADAEARFRQIAEAYEVLSDEGKRARYDAALLVPRGFDGGQPPSLRLAREIFDDVVGELLGTRRERARQGRDIRYTLTLSLEEAVLGARRTIEFESPGGCEACRATGIRPGGRPPVTCTPCQGRGELRDAGLFSRRSRCARCEGGGLVHVDPCEVCKGRGHRLVSRAYEVTIPPGTAAGAERVMGGLGEPGRFGGDPGNLRVTVNIRAHAWLERRGDDIWMDLPVSPSEAALGARIDVPTVDGWVSLDLPSGTQSGTTLRLKGRGVPREASHPRGDQLVRVVVETPRFTKPASSSRPTRRSPTAGATAPSADGGASASGDGGSLHPEPTSEPAGEDLRDLLVRVESALARSPGTMPRREALRAAAAIAGGDAAMGLAKAPRAAATGAAGAASQAAPGAAPKIDPSTASPSEAPATSEGEQADEA